MRDAETAELTFGLGGLGFSTNKAILLNAPPYYYAIVPVIVSSIVSDRLQLRGPIIGFNSICLIIGFAMLGFASQATVRYIGTFLATGAYVSNWAALTAYYQNNITGQWKRVFAAAVVTAFNGAGGVTGAYVSVVCLTTLDTVVLMHCSCSNHLSRRGIPLQYG